MLTRKPDIQPNLKTILILVPALITIAAVVLELRKASTERTWQGSVGFVPYDFRRPTLARVRAAWWDPSSGRLFTPREFGVGWAINLPVLFDRVRAFAS